MSSTPLSFDAGRAYQDVVYQYDLGPRTPGSQAHDKAVKWIFDSVASSGWHVSIQETSHNGRPVRNIVASRGSGSPWIIVGAHYDSRFVADHDGDVTQKSKPVPGANDGASGVAVLLELARILPSNLDRQIWLVFFDAEDQGQLPGWDWILGSRAFAASLTDKPDAVVILDMIGDQDLNIYLEKNSNKTLTDSIWKTAAQLGYQNQFIPTYKHRILDDHLPFIEKDIPAADIIDFDYPYWHTTQDTPDKIAPGSLKAVGDTMQKWLLTYPE